MSDTPRIPGADLVIRHFGYWPDFHDAEIHWLRLDRSGPTLEFLVHAFETTGEIDDQGCFVRAKHCLVRLRCREFNELEAGGFNEQNVLFEIGLMNLREEGSDTESWELEIVPSYGLGATVKGGVPEVVSLVPCDPEGLPREA